LAATEAGNKPVAEVLRDVMRSYVKRAKRKRFVAAARRQSQRVANSADESEVINWIRNVSL
jgi:chorismate mutase